MPCSKNEGSKEGKMSSIIGECDVQIAFMLGDINAPEIKILYLVRINQSVACIRVDLPFRTFSIPTSIT